MKMAATDEKQLFEQGLGNVTWWGFSPAKALTSMTSATSILTLGAGDGRHFIEAAIQEKSDLKFIVYEQNLMQYARQMLFVALLKQGHSKAFVEILGNIVLSPKTAQILSEVSNKILKSKILCETCDDLLENVDLSRLKSKEKDSLAEIFKLWSKANDDEDLNVDMKAFWEFRLRQLMADRFDAKEGIFEMDYQLRFVDRGGANVSHKEYCEWRSSGVAFDLDLEEPPERPNLTLLSTVTVKDTKTNSKALKKGYWGDVVTGPFISFAFEFSTEVQMIKTKVEKFAEKRILQQFEKPLTIWPQISFLSTSEKYLMETERFRGHFEAEKSLGRRC